MKPMIRTLTAGTIAAVCLAFGPMLAEAQRWGGNSGAGHFGAVPDPIIPADGTQDITGHLNVSGNVIGTSSVQTPMTYEDFINARTAAANLVIRDSTASNVMATFVDDGTTGSLLLNSASGKGYFLTDTNWGLTSQAGAGDISILGFGNASGRFFRVHDTNGNADRFSVDLSTSTAVYSNWKAAAGGGVLIKDSSGTTIANFADSATTMVIGRAAADQTVQFPGGINVGNTGSTVLNHTLQVATLDFPSHGPANQSSLTVSWGGNKALKTTDSCQVTTNFGSQNAVNQCYVSTAGAAGVGVITVLEYCLNGAAGTCDTLSKNYYLSVDIY